jgi:hypothetical protein
MQSRSWRGNQGIPTFVRLVYSLVSILVQMAFVHFLPGRTLHVLQDGTSRLLGENIHDVIPGQSHRPLQWIESREGSCERRKSSAGDFGSTVSWIARNRFLVSLAAGARPISFVRESKSSFTDLIAGLIPWNAGLFYVCIIWFLTTIGLPCRYFMQVEHIRI